MLYFCLELLSIFLFSFRVKVFIPNIETAIKEQELLPFMAMFEIKSGNIKFI